MLEAGTELQSGKYRIVDLIGNGGFGITYRAVHTMLGTTVVIKEYFPRQIVQRDSRSASLRVTGDGYQAAFDSGKKTFLNEARFLYGKKHPHIVTVLDIFEENNTAYLVMEYLEGQNLRQEMLAGGGTRPVALPPARVTAIMEALVSALEFLHQRSTYHLDIKPANVMACRDGRVVLIDFGAARQGTSVATQSHLFLSLDYAPPELMYERGYGPETDIYELGVMLYELLTGTVPPKAIERFAEQDWEPSLPEPWHTRVSSAMQLKRDKRPKDVRAWWESRPARHDATEWADVDEIDSELVPPEPVPPSRPTVTPITPPSVEANRVVVDSREIARDPSPVAGEDVGGLKWRDPKAPVSPGARPTPPAATETIMDEVAAGRATDKPSGNPTGKADDSARFYPPTTARQPDVPEPPKKRSVVPMIAAGAVAIGAIWLVAAALDAKSKKDLATAALGNLKVVELGLIMYAQDYDEKIPPMGDYQSLLKPYVKNDAMFIHPASQRPYDANVNVSLMSLAQFEEPANTVSFMGPVPEYNDMRTLGFLDGHVKAYSEATWQQSPRILDKPEWHPTR